METPIFIFAKDGKVRALNINDAMDLKLNEKGWKHTATMDAIAWLNYYLNSDHEDLRHEIIELKNHNK